MSVTPRTSSPRPPRQLRAVRPLELGHPESGTRQADDPDLAPGVEAPDLEPQAPDRPEVRRLEVKRATSGTVPAARLRPPAATSASVTAAPHRRGFVPVHGNVPAIPPGAAPERELLLPNVLIPGVSHSGAVQLAADLGRHPQICLPGVKRIGHFTPLRYGRPLDTPLDEYDRHFARWSGQRYRLEAGPDYFDGGLPMVRRVAESLPGARVVLVLRDPAPRLWASYADKLARGRVPRAMGFESYVERCLTLRANGTDRFEGNRHFRTLSSGFYVEYLPAWLDLFGRRARVVFTEDLHASRAEEVGALFDWLGLDRSAAAGDGDDLRGEGYGLPEAPAAPTARRWWPVVQRRTVLPGSAPDAHSTGSTRRLPRHCERTMTEVRALYARANTDLAGLLRERGYSALPDWLTRP